MKKRIIQFATILVIGLCVGVMTAQTKAPAISDSLQARFWKAQAAVQADKSAAQAAAENMTRAQAEFQEVIKELTDLCGKEFEPQMNSKGDPACVAKVVPKK
jgi:hypothetical protein